MQVVFIPQQRVKRVAVLAAVCCLAVATLMTGASVSALSNIGPDPDDLGGGGNDDFSYVVTSSNYPNIKIPTSIVRIYYKNNSGTKTVRISDANLCTDSLQSAAPGNSAGPGSQGSNDLGNQRDRPYGRNGTGAPANGTVATRYYVQSSSWSTPSGQMAVGRASNDNDCDDQTIDLSFPGSRLEEDPTIIQNKYYIDFVATIAPGLSQAQNRFNIRLVGGAGNGPNSAIVGYSATGEAQDFGLARDYPYSGTRDYSLPFAPDCNAVDRTVTARLYDLDNGSGASPTLEQGSNTIRTWINEYETRPDGSLNLVRRVPLTFLKRDGTAANADHLGSERYVIWGEDGETTFVRFPTRAGFKYRFVMTDVYYVNILQFRLPYDSIYFYEPCPPPLPEGRKFEPIITATPTIRKVADGEGYTFEYLARNDSDAPGSSTVNYTWTARASGGATWSGSGSESIGRTGRERLNLFARTADLGQGERVCANLSLRWDDPTTAVNPDTKSAAEVCIVIGKFPLVHIKGGDLRAGGSVGSGSCTATDGKVVGTANKFGATRVGSWGEYGVFAAKDVITFGSAAEHSWSETGPPAAEFGKKLTFANTPSLGKFSPGFCMHDYYQDYINQIPTATTIPAGSTVNINALNGVNKTSGTLVVNGGTIPQGKQVVILSSGNVVINTDIAFENVVDDVSKIPKVVIWADNILIAPGVERIDGVLVARNTLTTCDTLAVELSIGTCNRPLLINGVVQAGKIALRRTHGAQGAQQATPAEVFNLRPDFLLQSFGAPGATNISVRTEGLTELPPRY